MLYENNYIEKLTEIKGVILKNIEENNTNVKYFVMDMWKPYKEVAETYFTNSTIVIDKYHFIRQFLKETHMVLGILKDSETGYCI